MNATTKPMSIRNSPNFLADRHGLGAMSRAHREIIHLARLLGQLAAGLTAAEMPIAI